MATKQPFDRLDGETSRAYEAFAVYRDLGVGRTLEKVQVHFNRPSSWYRVIAGWSSDNNWVARAAAYDDYIDAEARKKLDRDAIKRKASMLQRHAQSGRALQAFGLQHVQTTKAPAKAADAISAIKAGIEIERKSEGLPEYLIEVMEASDDELARQYNELLAQIGGTGSRDETAGDASTGSDTASNGDTAPSE
jgi:hypothetical protein